MTHIRIIKNRIRQKSDPTYSIYRCFVDTCWDRKRRLSSVSAVARRPSCIPTGLQGHPPYNHRWQMHTPLRTFLVPIILGIQRRQTVVDQLRKAGAVMAVRREQSPLLFRKDKSSRGVSLTDEATPWDACPYALSNANTFIRARAYRVFLPRVLGSTSGASLGAFGTLGLPPWLIPPHSVGKPYTNSPLSSRDRTKR